jgi:hypothetical protein
MTPRTAGSTFIAAAIVFALPSIALAQLPSPIHTPGAKTKVNEAEVCAADFESSVKPVASFQRDQALGRYGRDSREFKGELDHLIPVSLGGSNDPDNLWPLPDNKDYGVAAKRELDSTLHKLVCDKTLTLKAAQDAIKKNWIKAYDQYVKNK